jgi:hypothetical protein
MNERFTTEGTEKIFELKIFFLSVCSVAKLKRGKIGGSKHYKEKLLSGFIEANAD